MKKIVVYLLVLILCCVGLGALTMSSASAHNNTLSGLVGCNDDGSTWFVVVKVDITNTPSDDTAETKAISTSAGTLEVDGGGHGVKAGSQVILNAWSEHAVNWPGVQTRKGNWNDTYLIANIPSSVGSVDTMVQTDWKKWNSADETRTFPKPTNCYKQPLEPQARLRTFTTNPTCEDPHTTKVYQRSTREPIGNVMGPWSPWHTFKTESLAVHMGQECVKHATVRVKVTDKCSCRQDRVHVFWDHSKVRVVKDRVNRTTWKITVTGKQQADGIRFMLPDRINGAHGWNFKQIYKVKTTTKPCPCKVRGDCHKLYPDFNPPHNCVKFGRCK